MQENKQLHLFDIQSIMSDVEKVIEKGLNKLLFNYIERHELLEKTHEKLMQLPSIVDELNIRKSKDLINNSDSDTEENDSSNFTSIRDITDNNIRYQVSSLENKLNKMEKKYESIIPILDKLLGKITHLNHDIKDIQNNRASVQEVVYKNTIEKSSVVKSSENENIEIHIEEPTKSEELKEEEISDDDVKPALITCSTILLKEEEKQEHDEDEVLEEEQELEDEVLEEEQEEEQEDEELEEEQEEDEELEEQEQEEEQEEDEELEEEEEQEELEEEEEEEQKEQEEDEELEEQEEQEEEVSEEASIETETKEELEEDDEVFEIDIDDKTYCTNNDENGFIWELTEDGEQGDKVGYFKEGEPFFYTEEN